MRQNAAQPIMIVEGRRGSGAPSSISSGADERRPNPMPPQLAPGPWPNGTVRSSPEGQHSRTSVRHTPAAVVDGASGAPVFWWGDRPAGIFPGALSAPLHVEPPRQPQEKLVVGAAGPQPGPPPYARPGILASPIKAESLSSLPLAPGRGVPELVGSGKPLFDVLKPRDESAGAEQSAALDANGARPAAIQGASRTRVAMEEEAEEGATVTPTPPTPTPTAAASEPIFWEIALVWSLSKNDAQKQYKLKEKIALDLAKRAKRKDAGTAGEGEAGCGPCARLCSWFGQQRDEWQLMRSAMLDPLASDMLRSPTWRQVRNALLGAGLAVILLRSKDADEFFMVVGATLTTLQVEAERTRFELRLSTGGPRKADKPAPFYVYRRENDEHYERLCDPPAAEGALGEATSSTRAADVESGAAAQHAGQPPAFASMERQRLIDQMMSKALLSTCGVNLTQLRNMHNACHDFLYLHDDFERPFVEDALGSNKVGCRMPRPADLVAHRLTSLERPRRYFGEQVGFYFAFLRFYTRALIPPSIFGAVTYVIYWVDSRAYLLLVPAFCLLLMIWSASFLEQWKGREATLRHVWDMENFAETEGERLGFRGRIDQGIYTVHGHWVSISDEDLEVMGQRLTAPSAIRSSLSARKVRELISLFALICMGFLCVLTTLGIFAFRAYISSLSIGPYLAGALNAIAISLLNTAFRNAALQLNEWENHRRGSSFTVALTYKIFIFQFFNCYFSLFYIAFVKPYGVTLLYVEPQECAGALRKGEQGLTAEQGCYDELQTQLMMIFLTNLLIGNLNERLSSYTAAATAWLTDWWEGHKFRGRARSQTDGEVVPPDAKASALRKRRSRARSSGQHRASPRPALAAGESRPAEEGRPPSPLRAIERHLTRAAKRAGASAKDVDLIAEWHFASARQSTANNLRGAQSSKHRTHPHPTVQAGAAPASLHEPGGLDECRSLLERVDEQDDLPMLLSEEHGLGPTFYEYNEMALQFGYICMFSVSFPPAALLALGNNVLEFYADAHKLLRGHRRIKYEGAAGIRPWDNIFRFLEIAGILTNTLIYLLLSEELRALPNFTIALVVLAVFVGVVILKAFIGMLVPDVPASVLRDITKEKWIAGELKKLLEQQAHSLNSGMSHSAAPAAQRRSDGDSEPGG